MTGETSIGVTGERTNDYHAPEMDEQAEAPQVSISVNGVEAALIVTRPASSQEAHLRWLWSAPVLVRHMSRHGSREATGAA